MWKLLPLMSSSKVYTKKDAKIQIKQKIKSKEICRNFFLWCHPARSILKKKQEFKSNKKLNRKKFVETSFFGVIMQGVYKKRRKNSNETRNSIERSLWKLLSLISSSREYTKRHKNSNETRNSIERSLWKLLSLMSSSK